MSNRIDLDTMFGDSTTTIKYGGQIFYAHPLDFVERALVRQSRESELGDLEAFQILLPIFNRRRINPKEKVNIDKLMATTSQALGKFFSILIDQDVTNPN